MPRTRKNHPPSLKAKVAVEAIKAHKTAAQIAQMFGVHPTQVGGWKKRALAGLPDIFGNVQGADSPAVRHRKGRTLQTDRPTQSGAGLSQEKSWPPRLKTAAYGSIPLIRDSPSNGSANCWECRARPSTTSHSRRARMTCGCCAGSTGCT
jgi:transposase-like protein